MKKKSLFVLFITVICLLSVACGKDKKEEKAKKKEETGIKELKCIIDSDDEAAEAIFKLDLNKKELTQATMSMTAPKEVYILHGIADSQIEDFLCEKDRSDYKSCVVDIAPSYVSASFEYEPKKYGEKLVEENKAKEFDLDLLNELKEQAENQGYTCTIS